MQTIVLANEALKELYDEPTKEQVNNTVFMWAQLQALPVQQVEGRRALLNIHIARNTGIGARGESGYLPNAGRQTYKNAYIVARGLYGAVQITGKALKAMQSHTGTFEPQFGSEMSRLADDLSVDCARQVYGDGTGTIALVDASGPSTTAQLDVSGGYSVRPEVMRWLYNDGGMAIDIGTDAAPSSKTSNNKVVSVNTATGAFVLTSSVTVAADDIISRTGNYGSTDDSGLDNDGQFELTGLAKIVDSTSTLQGLTVAAAPTWKSTETAGAALSEGLVTQTVQDVEILSGHQPDLLVTTAAVQRDLAADLASIRQNTSVVDLKAGYTGLDYSLPGMGNKSSQVALVWDKDCPHLSLFGLSMQDLGQWVLDDWGWMDEDGAVLNRVRDSTGRLDAYEATYRTYREIGATRRNSHFKLTGLTGVA